MMKQGINIVLPVNFTGIDFEDIEQIVFVFKQVKIQDAPELKTSVYKSDGTGDAQLREDTTIVDVPWTEEETYLFLPDSTVYMDTKITRNDSVYSPATPIVSFKMSATIFESPVTDNA